MNIDTIVQWATILSPILAVLLAWWTSRSSARSAAKQVESVKKLQASQIQLLEMQIDKEMNEAYTLYQQATNKNEMNRFNYQIGGLADSVRQINEREQDTKDNIQYQSVRLQNLNQLKSQLSELKLMANE